MKKFVLGGILAAAIAVPAGLLAWGPDRPAVDPTNGADHVVFNSIEKNPNYGNEKNFLTAKNPKTGAYEDVINVDKNTGEIELRVLVHNNANANLNLEAINTRLHAAISEKTAKENGITAYLSADNATPKEVYDDVLLKSNEQFNLAYIAGSARVYNNGYAAGGQGKALSDNLVQPGGALLGYKNEGDGKIPGCYEFINYVYFKVKPQFAPTTPKTDFKVEKMVSRDGENKWHENLDVQPSEVVDYRIKYTNTGETQQNNVVVKDKLPAGVSYVAGSTKLYNSQNPNGKQLSDGVVTNAGVNIGSHAPGASSIVAFKAKVAKKEDLECGKHTLKNIARVETDLGDKEDDADVTVEKECEEPKKIEVCELDTKKVITIDEKDFDESKHSKNLEDCKETPQPEKIEVCDLNTNEVIEINKNDFDESKHSKNLDDCKEEEKIEVCELDTKKVVRINKSDFDESKYSKDLADCNELQKPGTVKVCDLDDGSIKFIEKDQMDKGNYSTDMSDCDKPTPVVTPPELPKTGAGSDLSVAVFAILAAALSYALTNKRVRGLLVG